jgi:hypothetical protein
VSPTVLLAAMALAVFKPWGRIRRPVAGDRAAGRARRKDHA